MKQEAKAAIDKFIAEFTIKQIDFFGGLSTFLCKHSYSRTLATEYIQLNDLQNKSRTELISIPSFEFARSTFS